MDERGHLEVGGCDLVELARRYGTPLYVYDEATVRERATEFVRAMGDAGQVLYSAKAFYSPAFLRLVAGQGLGMDVVSAGELHAARAAGIPGERIFFLGNNKSAEEVDLAFENGCTLVIDGGWELELLRRVVPAGRRMRALLRVSPGIRPDTHDFISTGQLDSKFGFSIESGQAAAAVASTLEHPSVRLEGLHSHIGSQIYDLRSYEAAMEVVLDLAARLRRSHGFASALLSAGGGLGIAHTSADRPPSPAAYVETVRRALDAGCRERELPVPSLIVEPGRSIAGPAGVALYTVGSTKEIPGLRRYVAVDGGMGDNIRPKLYGARYEALLASDPEAVPGERVTIAGKYCESTDILIADAQMPHLDSGDVICIPAAGAYCLAMSSNYNGMPRPAVVMVADGEPNLIRRRESYEDLLAAEIY
ncbi:MAG: diaminopimelate decarboxylase [Candidatus Dormibacteraceae bacterium]